jgi:DNA-binding LacI/PurR family transcriptional regulator
MRKVKLTKDQVLRVASDASCDPRTVERYLRGETVRGKVRERIEEALRKLRLAA